MLVSVCMITYAHENYINDAIQGVLNQKCKFDIELIVSDDCSPDNTNKVVEEIKNTSDTNNIIKYVRHDINKGMANNFIWTIQQCKGKYIALCEGDDYWTDPFKLQKQIDLLEKNIDCQGVFHKSKIIYEETSLKFSFKEFYPNFNKPFFTIQDFIELGNLIPTASLVFRNNFSLKEIGVLNNVKIIPDITINFINLLKGNYVFIDELMSVYRINKGSVLQTITNINKAKKIFDTIENLSTNYNNSLETKKLKLAHTHIPHILVQETSKNKKPLKFLCYSYKLLSYHRTLTDVNFKHLIYLFLVSLNIKKY